MRPQLYICDTNMISSADRFWKAVERWGRDHPRIVVELSGQNPSMAITYTDLVVEVVGEIVAFRDVEAEEERSLDFAGAEIRLHSFEGIDAVWAFTARWEDGFEAIDCVLTELREFGKPS